VGVPFVVRASGAPEVEQGPPELVTLENARRKALAVREPGASEAVLGCDTVVALDGFLYGKPRDAAAARRTLSALSGRTHEVVSGLVLLLGEQERTAVARTEVTFRSLQGALLDWYLSGGEWRERAGGYAIQGAGSALVRAISGDYENVVGLPLATLLDLYPELLDVG
jgi:septum formation protein